MPDRAVRAKSTIVLVNMAATVLVIAAARAAYEVVVPLLLSMFIAVIVSPLIDRLAARGISRWLSVILVILGFTISCLIVLGVVGTSLTDFIVQLPELQRKLEYEYHRVLNWAEAFGIPVPQDHSWVFGEPLEPPEISDESVSGVPLESPPESAGDFEEPVSPAPDSAPEVGNEPTSDAPVESEGEPVQPSTKGEPSAETETTASDPATDSPREQDFLNAEPPPVEEPVVRPSRLNIEQAREDASAALLSPKYVVGIFDSLLAGLGTILSNGLMILVTVAFILLESVVYPAKLRMIMGNDSRSMERVIRILKDLRRYMVIKTWISIGTGLPAGVGLWLMGVEYAALWGMLAFLLNYVPNIGSLIAAIPPVVLALMQNGPVTALGTILLFLAINFVIGYLIEPPAMGRGLGLSTLVVWISLIFWGWVLGPVGMFLSVPLTMTLKIIFEGSEETRWISVLLGSAITGAELAVTEEPAPDPKD